MAIKKSTSGKSPSKRSTHKKPSAAGSTTSARSTVSGPSRKDRSSHSDPADLLAAKLEGTQALAASMRFNRTKPGEYGRAALDPQPGQSVEPPDVRVTASTLTETNTSPK